MRKLEIPILMAPEMAAATIAGIKNNTRRIMKPQPDDNGVTYMKNAPLDWEQVYNDVWTPWKWDTEDGESISMDCPYGDCGDLLYVRETHFRWGAWVEDEGQFTKTGAQKWKFVPYTDDVLFLDNAPCSYGKSVNKNLLQEPAWYKRPGLFMPKSVARLWLQRTTTKAERVQDISEEEPCIFKRVGKSKNTKLLDGVRHTALPEIKV